MILVCRRLGNAQQAKSGPLPKGLDLRLVWRPDPHPPFLSPSWERPMPYIAKAPLQRSRSQFSFPDNQTQKEMICKTISCQGSCAGNVDVRRLGGCSVKCGERVQVSPLPVAMRGGGGLPAPLQPL